MHAEHIAALTARYLDIPAVVGFEDPFVAALESELDRIGRPHRRVGGLLAAPGEGWTISAHIDRHGLVTRDDGTLGYAASEIGEHRPLGARMQAAVCRRFAGEAVVAYDPDTGEPLARGTVQHRDHCGLAAPEALVATGIAGLPAGVPVSFAPPQAAPRPGWLSGQLDNVVSAAIAVALLEQGFSGTVLFTRGEEIGRSWESLAAWFTEPERRLVVLDTSPFDDADAATEGAAVLRNRDAGATFDPDTVADLERAAAQAEVPVIWKDHVLEAQSKPLGRTELGRLVAATSGRVSGATLQVPTTDYHSNHETTSLAGIGGVWKVLTSLLDI